MKFEIGDRIRWHNNPSITGTIDKIGRGRSGIKWDHRCCRGEDGPIAYADNEHFILISTDAQSDFLEKIRERLG